MLNIGGLHQGYVIDHIEAGGAMKIYDYLNLDKQCSMIGVDSDKDFSDPEHLNVYGMRKMTSYLGNYMMEHYELDPEHDSKTTERWNHCYDKTEELLQQCESDTQNGIIRVYYEASFYHKTKTLH